MKRQRIADLASCMLTRGWGGTVHVRAVRHFATALAVTSNRGTWLTNAARAMHCADLMTRLSLFLVAITGASPFIAAQGALANNTALVEGTSERAGLTAGIALGVGHLGCEDDDCDGLVEAGGFSAHVGGMLSPKLALVGDLWGMSHRDDRARFDQVILTAALRYWPVDILWLSGGVGVARASFSYDADFVQFMDRSDTVPGLMIAAGAELLHRQDFALDLQVRAGTGFYDEDLRIRNYALSIGMSFY